MTLKIPGYPTEQFLMAIQSPSSFKHLPPLQLPSNHLIRDVEALQRSIVERSGLKPGVYSSLDSEVYHKVKFVYDELIRSLLDEISGLDIVDLTLALYERLERTLGHINKRKYESIPDMLVVGGPRSSGSLHQMWLTLSPFTEAIRWLIEIGVKAAGSSNTKVTDPQLARSIALAHNILLWDSTWEHIAYGVTPHKLTINVDFTIALGPTSQGMAAWEAYQEATAPWRRKSDLEWMNSALGKGVELATDGTDLLDEEPLNRAMKTDLGYDLDDWKNYSFGLIDSFDYHEYVKVVPKEEVRALLHRRWQVIPDTFESLLIDHSLSKETIAELTLDHIRPAEHARRDSRLFRRPVVLLEQDDGESICLYGIETLTAWTLRFQAQFLSGRIQLPRLSCAPSVKKAIGAIQSTIGNTFRDMVFARCSAMGLESIKEKGYVGTERIPPGTGFGPVDVFVVDRQFHRFVLVEVKDLDDPGIVPNKMKAELDSFRDNAGKLQKQVDWFTARVGSLKAEFGLSHADEYTVEGIIVVNRPRLWMYATEERLPVTTDEDFYELLTKGECLILPSVDVKPRLSASGLYLADGRRPAPTISVSRSRARVSAHSNIEG